MSERSHLRQRIIDAAADLLQTDGREAVTTRAVSTAAGVQPPTIYRQFTDMSGLLDAVAADGFDTYLAQKHALAATDDPVQDLRAGWDLHVQFGLEHPGHYLLMFGAQSAGGKATETQNHAADRLHLLIERVAAAGRLTVGVGTAAAMINAACRGVTLQLVGTPPEDRDPALATRLRETIIRAITGEQPPTAPGYAQHAVALKASIESTGALLSAGERAILGELLDRLANPPADPPS